MRRSLVLLALAALPSLVLAQSVCPSMPSGEPAIPTTDFNPANGLVAAGIPADNGIDPVGAFRFICGAGQINNDDPIVYPGQPGKSHPHQYYGNLDENAFSTYATMRAHGDSTCGDDGAGHAVNRSGYWMPALQLGNQYFVQPNLVAIYYKRIPASNPKCNDPARTDLNAVGWCVAIPHGLKMIAGYDMVAGTPPTGAGYFVCVSPTGQGLGVQGTDLVALAKSGDCPVGYEIEARIGMPACWDGVHTDSANHRSHVAYQVAGRCPLDHPFHMPTFTIAAQYSVTPEVHAAYAALASHIAGTPFDYTKALHFSSDEMRAALNPGSTFHADFFDAWDDGVKQQWTDGCINRHLNCSGGNMGNGHAVKGASVPTYNGKYSWKNPNELVPIPPKPMGAM